MVSHFFSTQWSRAHFVFLILIAVVLVPAVFSGGLDDFGRGLFLVLAGLLVAMQSPREISDRSLRRFLLLGAVFLGWVLFSSFFSFDRYQTMSDFFVLLAALLVGFQAMSLFSHTESQEKFLQWLLGGTILFAIYGFYVFMGTSPLFRLGSVFYQQNAFAGFMLPSLFYVAGSLFRAESLKKSLGYGVVAVFLCGVFMLTFARGASLAFLAAFLITALLVRWSWREWLRNAGVLLLVVFLGGVFAYVAFGLKNNKVAMQGSLAISSPAKFFNYETPEENGLTARLAYLRESQRIFSLYPLTGVGWGAFGDAFLEHREGLKNYTADPHNLIARSFVELGVVGGVVFLAIIGNLLCFVWREARVMNQESEKRTISFVIIGTFLALFFQNMVNADWLFPSDLVLFWVIVGLLIARVSLRSREVQTSGWKRSLFLIFGIGLAAVGGVQVLAQSHFNRAHEFLSTGNTHEALDAYRTALAFDPWNPLYHRDLAMTEIQLIAAASDKKTADAYQASALGEVSRGLVVRPYDPYFFFLRGQAYLYGGEPEKAEAEFKTALSHDRFTLFPAYRELANIYFTKKDYRAVVDLLGPVTQVYSEEVFGSVAWINPYKDQSRKEVADLWLRLGLAKVGLGDTVAAHEAFRMARSFNSGNMQAERAESCLFSSIPSLDSFRSCLYAPKGK